MVTMLPTLKPRPHVFPPSVPAPPTVTAIYPQAQRDGRHVAGQAKGGLLTYADLNAFAWWYGGGWLTLNRGKKGLRRVHRGSEDVTQIRR